MTDLTKLPLVLVPCFSGAPWDTDAFPEWKDRIVITGQLPNAASMEEYADIVADWTTGLSEYVLVGDSFGASVALVLAQRQPKGLRALIMSGGFAKADVSLYTRMRVVAGKILGQLGYPISIRFHMRSLGSRFDQAGTAAELRNLFLTHSDAKTFLNRGEIVLAADLRPGLPRVQVPTLILTPEDDRLIGPESARELVENIPGAEEKVLQGTGHLLRFTHESEYAGTVDQFLKAKSSVNSVAV